MEQVSKPLAEECEDLGFPDTEDKLNQYHLQRDRIIANMRYLTILDDIHLVKDPSVVKFLEHTLYNKPVNCTTILVCRELPQINLSGLIVRGMVSDIDENDLSFTESEMAQYLLSQGLSAEIQSLPEIITDTEGWAFIINFLVRMLRKSPGYTGYVRSVMKQNIFQLIEREAWDVISERLQRFMVRLSLVGRLSSELVSLLAEGDENLLAELNQQRVVYLRFDGYSGCYLIHYLFLDYLHSKQEILSAEEKNNTYRIAAEWCVRNSFPIDALTYYEKTGDYESLIRIIRESPTQLLISVAQHLIGVFERAPAEIFDQVEFFACEHVRVHMLAGSWRDALALLNFYEHKFERLPAADRFRSDAIGVMYYVWGVLRQLMCTVDSTYDFDVYYEKMSNCPVSLPVGQIRDSYPVGPWVNRTGLSRQGAPQEYLDALARSAAYVARGQDNWMKGQEELGRGELFFYQSDINAAKPLIAGAWEHADRSRQFAVAHLALFYTIRIAVWQGDYKKAEQALKDMEAQLEDNAYYNRFSAYDIALGWYYYTLRQPERIPGWLKGKYAPYSATNLLDNFGNQIKARYCYLMKNYPSLLSYIDEQKRRESTLYCRVEMLAMEACAHYQLKDKAKAFASLREAYGAASPNAILMPFIEMGKDMRTLTLAAMNDPDSHVPQPWLKVVNRRSSVYARHQTMFITEYKKAFDIDEEIGLTSRETEVLQDLNKGFSRSEIAASQGLSINTVRLIINAIYDKLKARNIADLIRIAHEQKLI
jgi:LuxR family maltose regulon positive regulatory protein